MSVKAYESNDRRIRTEPYPKSGLLVFSIAEPTKLGILLTEFSQEGEVIRQEYRKSSNALQELSTFVGNELELYYSTAYEPVKVAAKCKKCGGEIARELDLKAPGEIQDVPIVPMYVCRSCKAKYYSLSDSLLSSLVHSREDLFEKDELAELHADEEAFIERLQEIILRIFASKRILRLEINRKG
ncbi:MAG: hypothetical protein ACP5T4_00195 [Candidatus Micrarchaeia archaeon]